MFYHLSHILGWVSTSLCAILFAKIIGRRSKCKKLNQTLRKVHKPLGVTVIVIGMLHGAMCLIENPSICLSNLTGVLAFAVIILLAASFYTRKKRKQNWFHLHKHLSIILLILTVLHVVLSQ